DAGGDAVKGIHAADARVSLPSAVERNGYVPDGMPRYQCDHARRIQHVREENERRAGEEVEDLAGARMEREFAALQGEPGLRVGEARSGDAFEHSRLEPVARLHLPEVAGRASRGARLVA